MPAQTPGADIAKTVGDTVGELAGRDGSGQPLDAATLDRLLALNDDDDGDKAPAPASSPGPGKAEAAAAQIAGQTSPATSPYSPANLNPALNNPPPPSPATPHITATPGPATPVTELAADEHPAAAHPTSGGQGAPHPTAAVAADTALGGYPATGLMSGGGVAVPGPAGGAAGSAATAVATGAATAVAAPVLARPAPTPAGRDGGRHAAPRPATPMPHAHALLAGVVAGVRAAPGTPWTSSHCAIAEVGEAGAAARWVLATSDGLAVVPAGARLPAAVTLLSHVVPAEHPLVAEWAGHVHPAAKLRAAAAAGLIGPLRAVVTTEPGPAAAGETRLGPAAIADAIAAGTAAAATTARWAGAQRLVPAAAAAHWLAELGEAWRFGTAEAGDLAAATARLWAARWGSGTAHSTQPRQYAAVLAAYWWAEGQHSVAAGDLAAAADAAGALAGIQPDISPFAADI